VKVCETNILIVDEDTTQGYDWWKLSVQFSAASCWMLELVKI